VQAEVPSHKIFSSLAVTGTNTYYSGTKLDKAPAAGVNTGTDVNGSLSVSIFCQITGTPGATLTIQVSNSSDEDIRLGQDLWDTNDRYQGGGFTNGVATVASGQIGGTATFKIEGICRYKRLRLVWVNATGSGTVTAIITVKRS
jgi:hypothetical protein